MSTVILEAHCRGCNPALAFSRLSDFPAYPEVTDTVLAVELTHDADGRRVSTWEVRFREGILRWSEFDELLEAERTIRFVQREGDPASFHGTWQVGPADPGCTVSFAASFDLGMPSFAEVVEPLAARTLAENMASVVRGLIDPTATIEVSYQASASS